MVARGHGLKFYSSTFALGADLLRYMQRLALASEACLFAAAAFLAQSLSDISFSVLQKSCFTQHKGGIADWGNSRVLTITTVTPPQKGPITQPIS